MIGEDEDPLAHLGAVEAHHVGDLVADQAVAHQHARLDDEVLAVAQLGSDISR
jgi:hypothetical protein